MDRLLSAQAKVLAEDAAFDAEMDRVQAEAFYGDEQARATDRLRRFYRDER
jgi:hypothetical protein